MGYFCNNNHLLQSVDDCLLTVKVFNRDVQVKFSSFKRLYYVSKSEYEARRKRAKIINFSKRSLKRLKHLIRNSANIWKSIITLTYPSNFSLDGRLVKSHLNAFLQYLRRRNIKYLWVLEFQQRGAAHFHILLSSYIHKNDLSKEWYNIVNSNDENHLKAGTQIQSIKSEKHLFSYLYSYLNKLHQKVVPVNFASVGRFWGASRNLLTFTMYQLVNHYYNLSRVIRLLRRWYKAHLRKFKIKWRWRGQGFIAFDGSRFINFLHLKFSS